MLAFDKKRLGDPHFLLRNCNQRLFAKCKKTCLYIESNMRTLPQNGGNRVSEDLKFQNVQWKDDIKPPLPKTWIRARMHSICLYIYKKSQESVSYSE